jgi:hypothetical protein
MSHNNFPDHNLSSRLAEFDPLLSADCMNPPHVTIL